MYKLIQRFKNSPLGILASEVKQFVRTAPAEIWRLERKFVSRKPAAPRVGRVLLCYENRGFLLKPGEPVPVDHTNRWEALQIAKTFLDLGYSVDVINENNDRFVPTKEYSFFVGNRINFQRIAALLNSSCIKILHIDTAHWLFQNMAECRRLELLQRRRGVILLPQRNIPPNLAIEHADYATVLGNKFTMSTYSYANKPLFRVPISAPFLYPWHDGKDWDRVRRNYLWFGSPGFVHKGLDLVLEAFAQMPEYRLTVCGPLRTDPEFQRAYHKELYETPNIRTAGWVNTNSREFVDIANDCAAIVFPSCSESGGGGVINCMHAGLIPIVTPEASVDVTGFGVILKAASIDKIKGSVQMLAALSAGELESRSRMAWEYARANHTRERFAEAYRTAISAIISDRQDVKIAAQRAVGAAVSARAS